MTTLNFQLEKIKNILTNQIIFKFFLSTIHVIVQVIHRVIEIEIIQTKETEMIQITDKETTPRIDQISTIKIMDPVITPEIDTTITQGDSKTTLSHHIDLTLNIQNHNKTTEVVHQYTTDKLTKYNQQKKLNQTDNTQSSDLQLNHVQCETTDD